MPSIIHYFRLRCSISHVAQVNYATAHRNRILQTPIDEIAVFNIRVTDFLRLCYPIISLLYRITFKIQKAATTADNAKPLFRLKTIPTGWLQVNFMLYPHSYPSLRLKVTQVYAPALVSENVPYVIVHTQQSFPAYRIPEFRRRRCPLPVPGRQSSLRF